MKAAIVVPLLSLALASTAAGPGARTAGLVEPTSVLLTHSNSIEFDGRAAVPVVASRDGDLTKVQVGPVASWPITNAFIGWDQFAYNADYLVNPIVRIAEPRPPPEGDCDELVVDGQACGWKVNYNGCQHDGFGCFASRSSSDPGHHNINGVTFWLAGDANVVPNDHGARWVVHGRFDGGCSGWFSDGLSTDVTSQPACILPPRPTCTVTVLPPSLGLVRAGQPAQATVYVEAQNGPIPDATLEILPSPPPAGFSFTLAPNPLAVPGESLVTVRAGVLAAPGTTSVTIRATSTPTDGTAPIVCETQLGLEVRTLYDPCVCQ